MNNCAGTGQRSVSKQWRFCPALFFALLKKLRYNESISMTAQFVGSWRTRYERRVGMLEVGECEGTIKTMGERAIGSIWQDYTDRLFSRIQLTNEQFVYVLLSVVLSWPMPFVGTKVSSFPMPQPNGQKLCTSKNTGWSDSHTARILAQWRSAIMIWSLSAQKKMGYDSHENYSMPNPG